MPLWIYAATVVGIVAVDLLAGVILGRMPPFGRRADVHISGAATSLKLPVIAQTFKKPN